MPVGSKQTDRLPEGGLQTAYHSTQRVSGLTHALYRYPARFSPGFVRAVLEEFTNPGDWVLDPFIGGGTTAVEALSLGRAVAGFDINPLSLLLARAKTTPLYRRDIEALRGWASDTTEASPDVDWSDPRLRNAPRSVVLELAPLLGRVSELGRSRQREAARALLLHVGQAAVDGLDRPKDAAAIRQTLRSSLETFLSGISDLGTRLREAGLRPSDAVYRRRILRHGSAEALAGSRGLNRLCRRFGLVVTSPPYPGVHVLYHRWQVGGRAESPMPYWLSDSSDGLGPKHYTMGGRSLVGEAAYFAAAEASWTALRRLLKPGAFAVQLIAFADPERQLPLYLDAMTRAGYVRRPDREPSTWRDVPNRRWYFRVQPDRRGAASREVLLVHQLERGRHP